MNNQMRGNKVFLSVACLTYTLANSAPMNSFDEITVMAFREERPKLRTPAHVMVLDLPGAPGNSLARTLPDTFAFLPSLMVQKTGYGQGSPYLRGFTGFRTLFLIDGVRLNNSVFREGPNQYWNTVDPLSLGSAEVILGPASTLYGSDAMGGVVLARSPEPPAWIGRPSTEGTLFTRVSSADQSIIGRVQTQGRTSPAFAWGAGVSLKTFDDVRGGRSVGRQPHTGYSEQDADARLHWFSSPNTRWTLAHQSVRQDDAWRTHRTIYGLTWKGLKHGDDWVHSFDQERHLTRLTFDHQNREAVIEKWTLTLSRHQQLEDLYRLRMDHTSERQGFDAQTWGASLQMIAGWGPGRWISGASYERDLVNSYGRKYGTDGVLVKREIQGPIGDDAFYDRIGTFAQYAIPFGDDRLDIIAGARYTYARAHARRVKDPVTGNVIAVQGDWQSVCGSIRSSLTLDAARNAMVYAGLSQGFRAPNLSDLTRFDIARSDELETPAPDLEPEKTLTAEVGAKIHGGRLHAESAVYYTWIEDLIVRTPTGQTIHDLREVTKKNAGRGFIYGAELTLQCRLSKAWEARGSGSLMFGEVLGYPQDPSRPEWEYVSRLLPPSAEMALRRTFLNNRYRIEGLVQMAAKANKLSRGDRLDTQRIPPGGTPAFVVCHLRTGAQITDRFSIQAAIENILNADYRIHGSGINEPGRHLVVSAAWEW